MMNEFPPPPPPGGQPPYEPPTQVMQPAQPQAAYPQGTPPDPLTVLDKKRKKQLWILGVVAAILIVVAFVGGTMFEQKKYEAGADGYNEIYAAGAKSGTAKGQKAGEASGTAQGKQQGVSEGTAAGAKQALGNYPSWDTSSPYAVEMTEGSGDVPYAIENRTQMQPGTLYKVCSSGSGVCTESANSGTGGGATSTSP